MVFLKGVDSTKKPAVRQLVARSVGRLDAAHRRSFGTAEELYASGKKSIMIVKYEQAEAADRLLRVRRYISRQTCDSYAPEAAQDAKSLQEATAALPYKADLVGVTAVRATPSALPAELDVSTERTRREWKR